MSYEVEGYLDNDVSYRVRVEDGTVLGSAGARALLLEYDGDPIAVTPTGPTVTGSATDPAGVLAVLQAHTTVTEVSGDAPQLVPDPVAGYTY